MNAIRIWTELDLTAEARAGRLRPAFEVDDAVQIVSELVDAGRCPILTGDSGVGKTAIVHELARRTHAGAGPRRFAHRRIVQISLQRCVGIAESRHEFPAEFGKLVDAIRKMRRSPVLFIRDIGLAYQFDLEDRLAALAHATDAPVLGEGPDGVVSAMLEYHAVLQCVFAPVRLEEPSLEQAMRILRQWSAHRGPARTMRYTSDALEQALTLTHRFQSRSRLPHKAIELLSQSAVEATGTGEVRSQEVIERFCALHRVPRVIVDPSLPLDLDRVQRMFERAVFGQQEAVGAVVDVIGVLKAGLSDLHRPLATLLLVGPTGVGKTYIAQLVAEVLFGRRDRVVRLNLADYPDASDATRLFGDPTGTRPADQRGVLTNRLAGHAFAVLLLDEFEKAHRGVHDRFLQLIDEGAFINGAGETISCRSLIVIATSNAGYEHGVVEPLGFAGRPARADAPAKLPRLDRHFRFELLNRFDRVIHFSPLTVDDVRQVAIAELRRLPKRIGLRQRHVRLEVERDVVDWIVERGFEPDCGARHLRRTIEHHVTVALARVLACDNPPAGSRLRLMLRDGKIKACVVGSRVERGQPSAGRGDDGRRSRIMDRRTTVNRLHVSDVLDSVTG